MKRLTTRKHNVVLTMAVLTCGLATATTDAETPDAPPGGCLVTTTFRNDAYGDIPDPGTIRSSIHVSGLAPYVWDVDLQTLVRHFFCSDLDITLISPFGTAVTIVTDVGFEKIHVFNGTVWDDDAGDIENPGPVADSDLLSFFLNSPLVPEEAMGAFIGEDPNGEWILEITDDAAGDYGWLDGWSLFITTLPGAPDTAKTGTFTNAETLAIPDLTQIESMLDVTGAGEFICDVNLITHIDHGFNEDLDIKLISPGGTKVTLATDVGDEAGNGFNGARWDDDAGDTNPPGAANDHEFVEGVAQATLVPEEAMAAFIGEDPNGAWTLEIEDDAAIIDGVLKGWSLEITTCAFESEVTCQDTPEVVVQYEPPVIVEGTAHNGGGPSGDSSPSAGGMCGAGTAFIVPMMLFGLAFTRSMTGRRTNRNASRAVSART